MFFHEMGTVRYLFAIVERFNESAVGMYISSSGITKTSPHGIHVKNGELNFRRISTSETTSERIINCGKERERREMQLLLNLPDASDKIAGKNSREIAPVNFAFI